MQLRHKLTILAKGINMIKHILFAVTILLALPSQACEINYAGSLTDAQRQELKVMCEQMKAKALQTNNAGTIAEAVKSVDPTTIASIQAISTAIVDAVNGIAKGLGVAVNDFIKSPAGVVITTILIFYLIGSKIWGIFILILIALSIRMLLQRLKLVCSKGAVTQAQFPILWGLYTRNITRTEVVPYKEWPEDDQKQYIFACWVAAIVMLISIIVVAVNS